MSHWQKLMPNPNRSVLGHEIFSQHSQVSSPQGLLRTFGDICDTLDVIQVAADDVLNPLCRLVVYRFGLKTALFLLRYQVNWIHKKGLVLLFQMRYGRLLSGKK